MIVDIPCRFQVEDDRWVYASVGGHRMLLCKISANDVAALKEWGQAAQEQYAAAQTGPQPGPGGLYPEDSQK